MIVSMVLLRTYQRSVYVVMVCKLNLINIFLKIVIIFDSLFDLILAPILGINPFIA